MTDIENSEHKMDNLEFLTLEPEYKELIEYLEDIKRTKEQERQEVVERISTKFPQNQESNVLIEQFDKIVNFYEQVIELLSCCRSEQIVLEENKTFNQDFIGGIKKKGNKP